MLLIGISLFVTPFGLTAGIDAVVIRTGDRTYLGSMAAGIDGQRQLNRLGEGANTFTRLMICFTAGMVPAILPTAT
jgi:hypothetical protein